MSDFVDNWDNPLEGIEPDILEELMKNPRYGGHWQSLDCFRSLSDSEENGIYFYNPLLVSCFSQAQSRDSIHYPLASRTVVKPRQDRPKMFGMPWPSSLQEN